MSARDTVDEPVALGSPALADALEQQAATAEILHIISRSPADAQPVFEAIVKAGVRLFKGAAVAISRHHDGEVRPMAIAEDDPERAARWRKVFPFPLSAEYIHGAAILERRVVDVADVLETGGQFEAGKRNLAPSGYRAMTVVPLMRDGSALGALAVVRMTPGSLSARQIALLQTFADQAVIAIENVRLFNESKDALARQTATSDVLRVISRSITDTQPVFDTIAERATRLTGANSGWVFRYDGEWIHCASTYGLSPEALALALTYFPMRPSGVSYTARAIRDGTVVNVADALAETDPEYATKPVARAAGYRSVLSVPMFRNGQVVGTISVNRADVGLFADSEVELLKTFADQAVIAIENVRLFNEREARNRELAEALEQQTATSEILRVIARSPTDVQPVFQTIADAALRLCDASVANMLTFDGALLHIGALTGLTGKGLAAVHAIFPRPPTRDTAAGMAVLTRDVFVIEDVLADPHYACMAGPDWSVRSVLGVPLLRRGEPIGALAICRPVAGPFADKLIALLRIFADQAVIAIENVRLFNETEEALEHQTATSDVLQVIGSSMTDATPVFEKILDSCQRLFGASDLAVFLVEGQDSLNVGAYRGSLAEWVPNYPRPLAGTMSEWVIRQGGVMRWDDLAHAPDLPAYIRGVVRETGNLSVASAPLMWKGRGIGTIDVMRKPPRPFSDKELALLATFADQAAIAIENVRLFHAIEDKSRELEIASRHKSAFLANMSHELRTPMNAILGFTRIVLRETRERIDRKQAGNLEKILASARHLVGLINATLDLTRIEAGRIEITASDIALAPLLDECLRSVEPLLSDGVDLGCHIAPDLPPMRVDAEKLRQIVINLLSNAVKFTESGRIDVRAGRRSERVEIEVADSGIGIPADKLEAIFEEFEQVDASQTRAHGGTGLGLAIARRLARAMGGELSARSALGAGSSFLLDLPLRYREPDEA
jgi:signal transduction histidine kinase